MQMGQSAILVLGVLMSLNWH